MLLLFNRVLEVLAKTMKNKKIKEKEEKRIHPHWRRDKTNIHRWHDIVYTKS